MKAGKQFKSSDVLAVALMHFSNGKARTCCSAIAKAVEELTGSAKNPLYKRAVKYVELFRPTEQEAGYSDSKRLMHGKSRRTWWRTPSHPKIYAHKTERLIALSWAYIDAYKQKD